MKMKFVWQRSKNGKGKKITPVAIFLFILSGVLFGAICGEILVRCFIFWPLEKEYLRFSCYNYKKINPRNYEKDLFWKPTEEFKNVEYSVQKPKNTLRIICIGDSITQGFEKNKNSCMRREETFVYKLEQLLKENSKGRKIEVINAGSGGYSSLQGLRYLKKKLWKYNPDLVISWFGVNDYFYSLFFSDAEQKLPNEKGAGSRKLIEKSELYLFLRNFFMIRNAFKNPIVRVPPEDFYENCKEMFQFSREKKFDIVFIVPFLTASGGRGITYFERYREQLELLKKQYRCKVLDITPYINEHDADKLYIDLCHPNSEGNNIVAEAIYIYLKDGWKKLSSRAFQRRGTK